MACAIALTCGFGPPTRKVALRARFAIMDPVDSRLAALDEFVVTFAARGAAAHAPPDTMEAFLLGRKLGATGISTTAWTTADGTVVLNERSSVGSRLRRRPLTSIKDDDLPSGLVTLPALYGELGPIDLMLDLGTDETFHAILEAARAVGDAAEARLWLAATDLRTLIRWRTHTSARLVLGVAPRKLTPRPEQLAAELRLSEIDGLLLYHEEWNGGLVAMMHRFDRYTIGFGLEHERQIAKLLNTGIDAISGPHADRLAAAAQALYPDS